MSGDPVTGAGPVGWPPGGVHRVPGPASPVAEELARRGWDVAVLAPATSDAALWDGLVEALGLPAWFGRNLDALDEVLGGSDRATALVIAGWTAYARARPERWAALLRLLHARAGRAQPRLAVVLAD